MVVFLPLCHVTHVSVPAAAAAVGFFVVSSFSVLFFFFGGAFFFFFGGVDRVVLNRFAGTARAGG